MRNRTNKLRLGESVLLTNEFEGCGDVEILLRRKRTIIIKNKTQMQAKFQVDNNTSIYEIVKLQTLTF